MAYTKVSALTAKTTPAGTEELLINDGGVSKKITQTNLLSTALPKAGGTMTGTIAGFTSTGIDDNSNALAMTIDSAERTTFQNEIGINRTASSTYKIDIKQDSTEDGIAVRRSSDDAHIASLHTTGGAAVHSMQSAFAASHTFRVSNDSGSTWNNAMRIDNNGAVTMPYQPAFSAYTPNGSQGSWSDGANHPMPLTSSAFMRGGCSLGSNVVTVPTTGLYHVTVIFQSMTTSYNIRAGSIRLMHNGSTVLAHTSSDTWNAENYVGWSNHHYTWRSHYLIQASANDYFGARTWIYHNGGTPTVGYQVAIRGHLIG